MKKIHGRRNLPPLSTLRGFEAAARHLSFREAADELSLTQGAISRQIKTLEESLDLRLFLRQIRKVTLTHAGERLYLAVRNALDMIEQTTLTLKETPRRTTLVISALPTLTSTWIMPRLHVFIERHRNIEVRSVASIEPVDFSSENVDVAIRVGRLPGRPYLEEHPRIDLKMVNDWTDVRADELFPDVLVPVWSSRLAMQSRIHEAKDLLLYPLIHTSTRRFAWPDWLHAHGIAHGAATGKKYEFSHFFISLEAALRGQGIAIIPRIILSLYNDVDCLTLPLQSNIQSGGSYYVLTRESQSKSKEIKALREWVIAEATSLRSRA